jgi:alanyl-tRNA synthetase
MVQFKPYFLGEATPPHPRLASCQKCFRTTDIELVGDPTHNTFFEMLGNFSIGDYFKKEAIAWAWEFITQNLGLPPERLSATIFLDDDEAFRHWREIGLPEERILRFGEEDNFWGPAGASGPCGPDTEIFYDFGEGVGCGKSSCGPNCACGRFTEIATLVFMQYNQDKNGQRTLLPKPSIDTGMGVERTTAVVQGKKSIYETDLFIPLLRTVSELTGKKYGVDNDSDNAMRIIAEHSRGIVFLIADGVLPSNEGRGYVLRRLLRRAALFGRRLGLEKPFLSETAKTTMKLMGRIYPELIQRRDFILKVIEMEETRFSETLNTGLELIDDIITNLEKSGTKVVSGEDAFRLSDTYGFPMELTKEITAGRGFSIDLARFEKEMKKQRERARSTQKFGYTYFWLPESFPEGTSFVGYSSVKHGSTILDLLVNRQHVEEINAGQEAGIILRATPFYGEMGGQVGDTGEITSHGGRFTVTRTVWMLPNVILHEGRVAKGNFTVGQEVEAEVDIARRLDIARNHTATHLLQAALRQVLGEHIQQRGSLVAPDRLRFDFSHLVPMSKKEIQQVNTIVNDRIRQNLIVRDEEIPYKQAIAEGAIALFDEKYGDTVRVLRVGQPPISAELCGGTHVTTTGEIGSFYIISESSIGAGLRRIEAVTGRGAEAYFEKRLSDLEKAAEYLEAEPDRVLERAESVSTELKEERKRTLALERELSRRIAESLLAQVETVKGIKVLAARVPAARIEVLREMSDWLRDQLKSAIVVLGTVSEDRPVFLAVVTPDLVARGYTAGEIVRKIAKVTGGGGGGKPTMAQAGGKDKEKLDEALKLVKSLI